jgi:Zn-dependent metalloprotease
VRKAKILALALTLAAPAAAVMAPRTASRDPRRPAIQLPASAAPTISQEMARKVLQTYNARHGGGIGVASLGGGGAVPTGSVSQRALSFLSESLGTLGIDPQQLEVLHENQGEGGHTHVLYRQIYKGLPVEFSSVKVHFDPAGKVLGLNSNFRPHITLDVRPTISASIASYTVKQDAGEEPRTTPQLVVVLDPKSSQPRLAWKLTAMRNGRWRYYVDAHSGEMILRFDDNRYACAGGAAQGSIHTLVYAIDQEHGVPVRVPVAHETVYLPQSSLATSTFTVTDSGTGGFCFAGGAAGKIHTGLQGPFIRVSNFVGASSHYDNGAGVWTNTGLSVAPPHPYPNNAGFTIPPVDVPVDITGSAPTAVKIRPVFANFAVGFVSGGAVGEAADITDDDQVQVLDGSGTVVGVYVGALGGFTGAAVAGSAMTIRLRSNAAGQQYGYDLPSAQYLALTAANSNGVAGVPGTDGKNGSFDWGASSYNVTSLRAESALFYHLNLMHDFYMNGPNAGGYATLTPVTAMVLTGPNLLNAFYDPDYDDLFFGDTSALAPNDNFTDDATVSHHEYTHYVVQKIFNIQNFGQAGAMSEAFADYFSASSLDTAGLRVQAIGAAVNDALTQGTGGPLRDLRCKNNAATCKKLGTGPGLNGWESEIHADSIFVSQSLWDLREDRIAALGAVNGPKCVDNLVFNALLFFPESFSELMNAMEQVDKIGVAACGGQNAVTAGLISGYFGNHGIPNGSGQPNDPYDTASAHNDGFETAVDISTLAQISATISPASDIDFFTFAAGPGPVTLELDLPPEGLFYSGYMMQIYDTQHNLLFTAAPPFDGVNTNFPFCTQLDCTTTSSKVKLNFVNPAATQLYVEISGGPSDIGGSNSGVNNTSPYTLTTTYTRPGAASSNIVTATLDKDLISFSVNVTTWSRVQDYTFSYAQLRDQAQGIFPGTTSPPQPWDAGTRYLTFQNQTNALGVVSGQVQIAPGFNARFPSAGTVMVEVFGYNVTGSTISLGLSNPLNLTTNLSDVHAWNNVFNPANGQKTTVRYDLTAPGHLTMRLYSLNGALVATLFDGDVTAGKGSVDWTGHNNAGSTVASGIYLLQVQGPGLNKMQKIAVIK